MNTYHSGEIQQAATSSHMKPLAPKRTGDRSPGRGRKRLSTYRPPSLATTADPQEQLATILLTAGFVLMAVYSLRRSIVSGTALGARRNCPPEQRPTGQAERLVDIATYGFPKPNGSGPATRTVSAKVRGKAHKHKTDRSAYVGFGWPIKLVVSLIGSVAYWLAFPLVVETITPHPVYSTALASLQIASTVAVFNGLIALGNCVRKP